MRLLGLCVVPWLTLSAACGASSPETPRQSGGLAEGREPDASMSYDGGRWDAAEQPAPGFGDDGDDAGVCADVHVTPLRSIPSVVLLVDGSRSMECVYPAEAGCECEAQIQGACEVQGNVSRWQALSEALVGDGAQRGLIQELGSAIRFGLWVYNDNPNQSQCPGFPAQVSPALDQAPQILAAFPATPPGFNTPTGLALSELVARMPDEKARAQQQLGPQRIVLATDGQPFACVDRGTLARPDVDYESVLRATDEAVAKDVALYVMSLAPTHGEYETHLEEVARRGKTDKVFVPGDGAALRDALREIIEGAISCTVELSGQLSRPEACAGEAKLGDTPLKCGSPDGFSVVDREHVRLEGKACAQFKGQPGISLSMTFPCESIRLQ